MSLAYAILTALVEEPSTGAALIKRFDKSIGYFWNCTHQQIYRELKNLEQQGFAVSSVSPQKSTSFVYEIQPKGKAFLRDWIEHGETYSVIRDPFLVQLRAISNFEDINPQPALLRRRTHHEEKLKVYQLIAQKSFAELRSRGDVIKKMVLDAGIRREQSNIDWCDACLQTLAEMDGAS